MATRRNFTQEYKDQAVSLVHDSGRPIVEVARSTGVHELTLGKWVKKADSFTASGSCDPATGLRTADRSRVLVHVTTPGRNSICALNGAEPALHRSLSAAA